MTRLHQLLLDEVSCMEAFLDQLEQERQTLTDGRFIDLTAIAGKKTQLLGRIAELDAQRELTQAGLGLAAGHAGVRTAGEADPAVQRTWDLLLAVAQRVRTSNSRNGAMIYTHLDFTQKALGFLQRVDRSFYGPDGATKTASHSGMRLASG